MMMDTILAIDTSQSAPSVAVFSGGRLLADSSPEGQRVSDALGGLVAETLSAAGMDLSDIARIVVSTGPGSATGLRIGLAYGAGLADALGIPIGNRSLIGAVAAATGGFAAAYEGAESVVWTGPGGETSRTGPEDFSKRLASFGAVWITADLRKRLSRVGGFELPAAVSVISGGAVWLGGEGNG